MSIYTLNFSIALRRCNSHTTIVCNSTVRSTFPELCNHHHNQFQKSSSSPKRNPCPLAVTFPPHTIPTSSLQAPIPGLGNHRSTFCSYNLPILNISYKQNHTIYGLLWLLSDCIIFSKFIPFTVCVSTFLSMAEQHSLYGCDWLKDEQASSLLDSSSL